MRRQRVALVAAALLAGCAGMRRPPEVGFRLPARYRANQVVHVTGAGEGELELLASVAAGEQGAEVVLFDAALQLPLLRASSGPGGETEEVFAAVPPGNGRRLAALLRTLNGLEFTRGVAGALTGAAGGWRFTVSEVAVEAGCEFPRRIHVEHRYGGPRIDVETIDVSCAAPGR